MKSPFSFLSSFFTQSSFTLLSRLLGLIRDIILAQTLGTSALAQAFSVAFRIPNMFRSVFGEGAYNTAFVPSLSSKLPKPNQTDKDKKSDQHEALLFANTALFYLSIFLGLLIIGLEIFTPQLLRVIAPGFETQPEVWNLTVLLTRLCLPYAFFICCSAHLSAVLNSLHCYKSSAFTPLLLNLSLILFLAFIYNKLNSTQLRLVFLAATILFSGLLQVLWLAIDSHRKGFTPQLLFPRGKQHDIRNMGLLMIPGLITACSQQITILLGIREASLFQEGVVFLYYADRLYQLPLALIGVSLSLVMLPIMVKTLQHTPERSAPAFTQSLMLALTLAVPASLGLFFFAEPILITLFQRGAFSLTAAQETAQLLQAFALGLPAFVLTPLWRTPLFALKLHKWAMILSLLSTLFYICTLSYMANTLELFGIALNTSIAAWFGLLLLILCSPNLCKKSFILKKPFFSLSIKLVASGFVMIVISFAAFQIALHFLREIRADTVLFDLFFLVPSQPFLGFNTLSLIWQITLVLKLVVIGAVSYFTCLWLMLGHPRSLSDLKRNLSLSH